MCFSAGASFAVGAGLAVPGYYSVSSAKSRGMLLFASTPLLFCFHQLAEGCLWLSLQQPEFAGMYKPALYGYSFISQPLWPVWVPLAMWLMEPRDWNRKILFILLLLGIGSSLYMFYCLVSYPIAATANEGHIRYFREFPHLNIMRPINFLTIAVTPFFSSLRYTKWLAAGMMIALIIAYFIFKLYFISVWCFFAAVISPLIILVVRANQSSSNGLQHAAPATVI